MPMWSLRPKALAAALAAVLGAGLLAGCSGQGASRNDNTITVWSLENLPDRMAVQRKLIDGFERQTGIHVKLVGVDEGQLPQLTMSAAAAGKLPDVMGAVPLAPIWQMYSNDLLDTRAMGRVVNSLGRGTFNGNGLRLVSDGSTQLGVPSDAWMQILVYRKDMFAKAGLAKPDTYASILKAARTLDHGAVSGISIASDPSDVFTQQSFEDLALANGCQLVTRGGKVTLDSPKCQNAFRTYGTLAGKYGPPGTQTVDTTRATYFAGRSSMVVWSTFLLDELAGLRDDALPSCPQCKKDKTFLSDNSGIVTALKGPGGAKPAQFGEITAWEITRTAETPAAEKFVRYMMSTGYKGWIGMAPEGKIPVRDGTATDPRAYLTSWRDSRMGVTSFKPLKSVYPGTLLDQLADGVTHMQRWGITQGQGNLVGATVGELPVAKAIGDMSTGQTSPDNAARSAQKEVAALQKSLQ
jgi:multiple sugar transport system substrate-binding protein